MSDTPPINVGIVGAAGRMGQRLCALCSDMPGLNLAAAVEQPNHPAVGSHASDADHAILISDRLGPDCNVIIDFSSPESTRATLKHCTQQSIPLVIGTTGLSDTDDDKIQQAASQIPILQAANFSLVVNVLNQLATQAARMLGDAYDIELMEAHHRFKKDAPSGTALMLARSICNATNRSFDNDVRLQRHGNDPRRDREITIQALRLGDTVGEHTVYFGTLGERMELRHVGGNRDSYATGALRAAQWLASQSPGRYSMAHVLGLE